MTYPASDVVTTNLDAAGDSPAAARTDLLDLATKFNQLRNHVSAFMQVIFTSANAAAARASLSAAASGANADITSLSGPALGTPASGNLANCTFPTLNQSTTGNAATATTDNKHFGVGQTWQNVGGSRVSGTTYTNSTTRPISVSLSVNAVSGSPGVTIVVGGVTIIDSTFPYGSGVQWSFVVPPSTTYVCTIKAGTSLAIWAELR